MVRSISPDDVDFEWFTVEGEGLKVKGPSLNIDFCGIPCENPFFLASSAVCTN